MRFPESLMAMESAAAAGQWARADAHAAIVAQVQPRHAGAWRIMGQAALALGHGAAAARFLARAVELDPYFDSPAESLLAQARAMKPAEPHPGPRYLVAREWGQGFWADVDHAATLMLAAELTGRTPVVWWGDTTLYRGEGSPANAWEAFFDPVSGVGAGELSAPGLSVYPPKWSRAGATGPLRNRWSGEGSRVSVLELLSRPENVVVADFYTPLATVARWAQGRVLEPLELVREARRTVGLLHPLAAQVQAARTIRAGWGTDPVVALHIRGTDKFVEAGNTQEVHETLINDAAEHCRATGARLFLLTDSASTVERLRGVLHRRLITMDATRSDGEEGLHLSRRHDGRRLGDEVLRDTLLACQCDAFYGLGWSNVASMVMRLREWPAGMCRILGPIQPEWPNPFLHEAPREDESAPPAGA